MTVVFVFANDLAVLVKQRCGNDKFVIVHVVRNVRISVQVKHCTLNTWFQLCVLDFKL